MLLPNGRMNVLRAIGPERLQKWWLEEGGFNETIGPWTWVAGRPRLTAQASVGTYTAGLISGRGSFD